MTLHCVFVCVLVRVLCVSVRVPLSVQFLRFAWLKKLQLIEDLKKQKTIKKQQQHFHFVALK